MLLPPIHCSTATVELSGLWELALPAFEDVLLAVVRISTTAPDSQIEDMRREEEDQGDKG